MTGHEPAEQGYRLLPHTADMMIEAWAPTAERCLAEAVRALVASFAEARRARPERMVAFTCDPAPDRELLVELLEEVIYLVDAHEVVPVQVAVARTAEGGLVGEFGVTALSQMVAVGVSPKAITRHRLRFEHHRTGWRCRVVVDV